MASIPLYYTAGFSTSGSALSMTIKSGAGTGTIAPAKYAHHSMILNPYTVAYTEFALAVVAALNAAAAGTYTVQIDTTPNAIGAYYTIYAASAFTLTFPATDAGNRCKAALGFSNSTPGGLGTLASPYVGDRCPWYLIVPEAMARSEYTNVYEPGGIAFEAVSDGGTPRGTSKQTSELWNDWSQMVEPLAKVFVRSATSPRPWSYQHLFKHCRGHHPIGVYESTTGYTAHKLRADGASFTPDRYQTDYDGLWSIPFRTRDLGLLTA